MCILIIRDTPPCLNLLAQLPIWATKHHCPHCYFNRAPTSKSTVNHSRAAVTATAWWSFTIGCRKPAPPRSSISPTTYAKRIASMCCTSMLRPTCTCCRCPIRCSSYATSAAGRQLSRPYTTVTWPTWTFPSLACHRSRYTSILFGSHWIGWCPTIISYDLATIIGRI